MGHFYKYDNGIWSPCHTVPYADPAKGMRDTTLGDARKLNLVPSVMGIIGVINQPVINNYRVDQAIRSALTLPREQESFKSYSARCIYELGATANDAYAVAAWCFEHQPKPLLNADEFAKLVLIDAEAHSEAAKLLGTEIHDHVSNFLKEHFGDDPINVCQPLPDCDTPEMMLLCQPVREWLLENVEKVHAVEQIVGSLEHGYAGTLDLDADIKGIGRAIIDFKSQPVKRNGTGPKPAFYFSYGKQLAAYAVASVGYQKIDNAPKLVSIIIDKANAGEVFVKAWDNPQELWRQFLNNADSWRFENQYDPRVPEEGFKALTKVMNEH